MKAATVQNVEFFTARSPHSRQINDATHKISEISFIVCRIYCGEGLVGESYLLSFDFSPQAIRGALQDVAALAARRNIFESGAFLAQCDSEFEYFGRNGLQKWASALIEIAMWDAIGKHLGVCIPEMFGIHSQSVPVYGSGGWLSYSSEELVDEAVGYARRGFRAVKIKVGSPDCACDLERLAKVREAVGSNVQIMMDANQGLSVARALELSRKAAPIDITWFEEPIDNRDFDGYQTLRTAAGMSLAMGEREYDCVALRELCRRNALDLWQPDILRIGGVRAWKESAAYAAVHGLPVLPHFYKEYDVPLLMTIPNAFASESFDWVDPLIDGGLTIEDGFARPSGNPGWGFQFKNDCLSEL